MMQSYISGGRQGKVSDGFPSTKHESAGKSQRDLCAKTHSSPVAQKKDTYQGIILVRITGFVLRRHIVDVNSRVADMFHG